MFVSDSATVTIATAQPQQRPVLAALNNRLRLTNRRMKSVVETHSHAAFGILRSRSNSCQFRRGTTAWLLHEDVLTVFQRRDGQRCELVMRRCDDDEVDIVTLKNLDLACADTGGTLRGEGVCCVFPNVVDRA